MNISKGLKEKNRIAGRISKLQNEVKKYNQFREDKPQDFNSEELLKKLQEEWAFLIDLKTRIAKANHGIADKLVRLTEAKAELTFWNSFGAGSANEPAMESRYIKGDVVTVFIAGGYSISNIEIQEHIEHVQLSIENLQDEIDDYNATTQI